MLQGQDIWALYHVTTEENQLPKSNTKDRLILALGNRPQEVIAERKAGDKE